MSRSAFLFTLLALIALIAMLHHAALAYFLYWRFWWFDIVVHFLSGLWVGLAALWLVFYSNYIPPVFQVNKRAIFLTALVSVFVVAIGWELFEWFVGLIHTPHYVFDTGLDIVMGLLGALASFGYVWHLFLQPHKTAVLE